LPSRCLTSTTAIFTSVSNNFKDKALQAALKGVYAPDSTEGHGITRHASM